MISSELLVVLFSSAFPFFLLRRGILGSRWRKVIRDLWLNKTCTLLVVLSIAIGVFVEAWA